MGGSVRDRYDCFVSYNSRDVAFARQLSERLSGEGYQVWFNEYRVHSDQQARFQHLINRGLDRCERAILIVGAGYATSPYCNVEVERILRLVPLERIALVELHSPADLLDLYPELAIGPTRIRGDEDPLEALHARGALRAPPALAPIPPRGRHEWIVREASFAFDNSTWAVEPGSMLRADAWSEALSFSGQPRAERTTFVATEGIDARLLLEYAQLEGLQADRIRARMMRADDEAEADDRRRLREELEAFRLEAEQVFAQATRRGDGTGELAARQPGSWGRWESRLEEVGVHLYSARIGGREIKQRLFSFRLPALPAIFRVYKLSFLHPVFGDAPFVVRFVFRFRDDERAFFAALPWCDALVGSFRLVAEQPLQDDELRRLGSAFGRRLRGGGA